MSSPSHCQDDAIRQPGRSDGLRYGAWPSPLQAADVAAGSVRRSEPRVAGNWAYWVEERPLDQGRGAVVRVRLDEPDAQPADVAHTAEADIRTAVHEYGGGAWLPYEAPDGSHFVLASCMSDHRVRLFDVTGQAESRPVTPEPELPGGLRYADPALVHDAVSVWVREQHDRSGHEPRNELVSIRLDGNVSVVATGADFYSSPRPSPDGTQLAYLSWDHPNMPWDHTRLCIVDLRDGEAVAGTERVLVDGPRCNSRSGVPMASCTSSLTSTAGGRSAASMSRRVPPNLCSGTLRPAKHATANSAFRRGCSRRPPTAGTAAALCGAVRCGAASGT